MSQENKSTTKSHTSSKSKARSDISSVLALKIAEAEAAKAKADFASKEATVRKRQAQVAEKQATQAAQAARIQVELEADLEIIKSQGLAAETAAQVKALGNYEAGSTYKNNDLEINLPDDDPRYRTERYVESIRNLSTGQPDGLNVYVDNDVMQTVSADQLLKQTSQHLNYSHSGAVGGNENKESDPEIHLKWNPDAQPYYPVPPQATQVPISREINIESQNISHEITNFLVKKELLLTRLRNYDDKPENYISWKTGFLHTVNDIGINEIEQLDLLVRWLGPTSSKQALSLKSSNMYNPNRALQLIWERLDERYGAPEMIDLSIRNKLDKFPKLTNRDTKMLYDLLDILLEIDSLKQNEPLKTVLSYFDSSSGVSPIVRKLTYGLQDKWMSQAFGYKLKNNVPFPPFSFFVKFIKDMSRMLNDPSFAHDTSSQPIKKPDNYKQPSGKYNVFTKKTDFINPIKSNKDKVTVCPLHNLRHSLNDCRGFRRKSQHERKELLRQYGICYRCCDSNKHFAANCEVEINCKECDSNQHPTALHFDKHLPKSSSQPEKPPSDQGGEPTSLQLTSRCTQMNGKCFQGKSCSKNLLVSVYHKDHPEQRKQLYAVLDEQSNISLARSKFFEMFGENGVSSPYTLSSCNGSLTTSGRRAKDYVISSLDGTVKIDLPVIIECDDIPDVRDEIPTPDVAAVHPHLNDVASKIHPIDTDSEILLLLGRDIPDAHHVLKQITGPRNSPYAQQLPLGWVIIGETCLGKVHRPTYVAKRTHVLSNGRPTNFIPCENDITVKPCYEQKDNSFNSRSSEDLFVTTKDDYKKGMSIEDRKFLCIMDDAMVKGPEGSWISPLPFKEPRPILPNNRPQAYKRAKTLHSSLTNNPIKKEHFFEFMGKILDAGHAELAPSLKPNTECWYLPLFGVYHPQKPDQIRGVFDSSAKFDGLSLNEVLLKGPDLTNSLLGILLRFRENCVAVTADIERMFYCFYVEEKHRDYLRFLWYKDNDFNNELVEYRMTVHVFGNSPSPAIATYGLRKAAENGAGPDQQDVINFVTRNFYVDDALVSLPTSESAADLLKRTQKALATGGNIRLHKIASNNQDIFSAFPSSDHAKELKDLDLGSDLVPPQRSLGLVWDVKTDTITFKVSADQKPFTRRGVLSTIHSLFDPIGFVSPLVIRGKILMRQLTTETSDWDVPLPPHYERLWDEWKASMKCVSEIHVPRQFKSVSGVVSEETVIYSDASEKAIAAVAYLKTKDRTGNIVFNFVLGKAKLAPLHGHTIPRLELCATVLAIEIGEIVSDQLNVPLNSTKYFTDSKIVLGYLHNETRRFHVYVSNRVERVRRSSEPHQWRHVASDKNPADEATRDSPVDLFNSQWLNGPPDDSTISISSFSLCDPENDKEVRQINTLKTSVRKPLESYRFERFSSWKTLIQTLARLKHISETFHNKTSCKGWHTCSESRSVPLFEKTEMFVIQTVQSEVYAKEIECIRQQNPLPRNSAILSLSPYIDNEGILRVGGRLNRSKLNINSRNPILIPGKHYIAKLLVRHHHEAVRHQGRHFTEGAVRAAGLWITGCKRLVSSLCHNCVKCRKLRAPTAAQVMADLPVERLTPAPPFTFVGVDTFGYFEVETRRTRGGSANSKRWAIVFSCLVSRAIHIEIVEDMSASAFINALRRFISIRGPVKQFRSDCGTNFVGAVKELNIKVINVDDGEVKDFLNASGVEWVFNAPHSSHMGGSWERMIGIIRRVLNSMFADMPKKNVSHDVLVTFFAEVCAIVNNRPLVPISSDPDSPFVLSPNILLTQKSDIPSDLPKVSNIRDIYDKQWKRVQLLADTFWSRWRKEYLPTLQTKRKWTDIQPNVQRGDIILLKDKSLHRNDWGMGVVEEVVPGSDNLVRKCVLRLFKEGKKVFYTRPISEIVILLPREKY